MIIVVFGTDVYKEYLLPNLVDAEYSVTLRGDTFHLRKDMELLLEVDANGWKFMPSGQYRIRRIDGERQDSYIEHGEIAYLTGAGGENLQLIAAQKNPGFLVMQKFDLAGTMRITIGNKEDWLSLLGIPQIMDIRGIRSRALL